jgi:hypothetical protein
MGDEKNLRPLEIVMTETSTVSRPSPSAIRYDRQPEHGVDALRLLDGLMQIPQDTPNSGWPSTAELQAERIYGLRPVNRLGDLKKGRYNGHRYDIEMVSCGHGVNRWRLYWPNRPGYPKDKRQGALPLSPSDDWYTAQTSKPRPSDPQPDLEPLFAVVRP